MEERRKWTRVETELRARWETATGVHEGTVVNCSAGGCFVRTEVEEPRRSAHQTQNPVAEWQAHETLGTGGLLSPHHGLRTAVYKPINRKPVDD